MHRQTTSLPLLICLYLTSLHLSYCTQLLAAEYEEQKSSAAENNLHLNCTYRHPRRRKYHELLKRKQRKLTRKAYRMAVLAKLAYWDYRRDGRPGNEHDLGGSDTAGTSHTCFALNDDPPPPAHLLPPNNFVGVPRKKGINTRKRIFTSAQQLITGMVLRIRVLLCRTKHNLVHMVDLFRFYIDRSQNIYQTKNNSQAQLLRKPRVRPKPSAKVCFRKLLDRHEAGRRYQIEWTLQNWHESKAKIKWHDTDLIIATSGASELVLSFAGTASTADQFTNIQTFEPVAHSGLFAGNTNTNTTSNATHSSPSISGSIHRGFLNAYSRVTRGNILRLCDEDHSTNRTNVNLNEKKDTDMNMNRGQGQSCNPLLTKSLHRRYKTCIARRNPMIEDEEIEEELDDMENIGEELTHADTEPQQSQSSDESVANSNKTKWERSTGQRKDKRNGTEKTKKGKRGRKMIGCQSHGEKLIDILREIVIDALHSGHSVYLTGHSQGAAISTLLAFDIVINFEAVPISNLYLWTFGSPEVADSTFYQSAARASPRFRAFLRDRKRYHRFVTRADNCETDFVTTLVSKGLNRRTARRLGGVRGNIIHAVEPVYLPLMAEKSGIEGHFMKNYLKGISIESPDHPLATDFPSAMSHWLGEVDSAAGSKLNSHHE